jgi:hypothetical protein
MAKPPDGPPKDFPPRRDELGPRRDDAGSRREREELAPRRERDWYGGRTGSRVSVEIAPGAGRRESGYGPGRFGEDRPPRVGASRFGDRPPREGAGGRPSRDSHPPIDWEKWEADLEAALKARNGET